MENRAKVSVIVPVYKVAGYLDKCIESIVNQTYKNLEIILVDDGSPDNCPQMCDEWAKKDERIKVIHKENGGVSSARNRGLDVCTGDYVYFCDSDDYLEHQAIEKLVDKITDNDVCFMAFNEVFDKKTVKKTFKEYDNLNEFMAQILHSWEFGLLWNKLYIKTYIDFRFDESFKIREDLHFNAKYFKKVKKIGIVNEQLYNYIHHEGSLTRRIKSAPVEQIKAIHFEMLEMLKLNFADLIPHQNAVYLKSFINILKPYAFSKFGADDKQKIVNYLDDESVMIAMDNYVTVGFKEKLFIYLLKRKRVKTLLFLIRFGG